MKRKPVDRRVHKTRTALRQALIQLILEKRYDTLSIQEICERANVGRSTFYAHFATKSELLLSGFDYWEGHILEHLRQQTQAGAVPKPFCFSPLFLEHVQGHGRLYRALAREQGGAMVTARLRQSLTKILDAEFRAWRAPRHKGSYEGTIQFLVGAFLSLVAWWLDHTAEISPRELDRLFRKLAVPVLEAEFGRGFSASPTA